MTLCINDMVKDIEAGDNRYDCFHPIKPICIFNCAMDADTLEDCEINIAKECNLLHMMPIVNGYLTWLNNSKAVLTSYFQEKAGEKLPDDWFESIEVYHFSITFNGQDNFGATIACGESLFADHTIEFDFEMYKIVDNRLNG